MPEYRMTPEREAALARMFRMHDATHSEMGRPILPPNWLTAIELQWQQEDEVIREYGSLVKFDWTVTDGAGKAQLVRSVSTGMEALSKALELWRGIGYKPVGELRYDKTLSVKQDGR